MSNWSFSCVKSCFLKPVILGVFFLSVFTPCLLAQKGPELQLKKEKFARISLQLNPPNFSLNNYLDSLENASGLSLLGLSADTVLSLETISPDQNLAKIQQIQFSDFQHTLSFNLNFNDISERDSILISDEGSSRIYQGNMTAKNIFSTDLSGEVLVKIIDHYPFFTSPATVNNIAIGRKGQATPANFGASGGCQVNARCEPEDEFPDLRRSALRIIWRSRNLLGFCSGHLINNSSYDLKPYVITAEHCALASGSLRPSDLDFWMFYFNYESPRCENPEEEGNLAADLMQGSRLVARSDDEGGEFGSDFLLLELTDSIPAAFDPYWAGWSRSNLAPERGLCYHHPSGDIKKVSTYEFSPTLGTFSGQSVNTHWILNWTATSNGHGTTEGGSSGSGLADQNGLLRGVLTGGSSSCQNLGLFDFYGTISYGWQQNGNSPENQLAPWLDPAGLGFLSLGGFEYGEEKPDFSLSSLQVIPNPVTDNQFELFGYQDFTSQSDFVIYDLMGQIIYQQEFTAIPGETLNFRLPDFRSGVYLLSIEENNRRSLFKIWIL